MTSYAEVAKKAPDENLEANVITNNQSSTYRNNNTTITEDKYSENYDAAVYRQEKETDNSRTVVEEMKKLVTDADERQRKLTKRGSNEVSKCSKSIVFLTVAVDIALAGLLVGTVYKKPSINRAKLGISTVGLSLFYGLQWVFYQKSSE